MGLYGNFTLGSTVVAFAAGRITNAGEWTHLFYFDGRPARRLGASQIYIPERTPGIQSNELCTSYG